MRFLSRFLSTSDGHRDPDPTIPFARPALEEISREIPDTGTRSVLDHAEDEAREMGIPVQEYLAAEFLRLSSSKYPLQDCFDEEELAVVASGTRLDENRMVHLAGCEFCTGGIAGCRPDTTSIERAWLPLREIVVKSRGKVAPKPASIAAAVNRIFPQVRNQAEMKPPFLNDNSEEAL